MFYTSFAFYLALYTSPWLVEQKGNCNTRHTETYSYYSCLSAPEAYKRKQEKKAAHSPSHSFAACIYSVLYLQALYFMATFLPLCQVNSLDHWREFILGFGGSYSTSFFPSHTLSLSGHPISSSSLFLPFYPHSLHTHTPSNYAPLYPIPPHPPPRTIALPFHSPSPMPLSQLPVELAAVQDSADGSVIRSASLQSLFSSSPLPSFPLFSLFNQITEENFSGFGFEFFLIFS